MALQYQSVLDRETLTAGDRVRVAVSYTCYPFNCPRDSEILQALQALELARADTVEISFYREVPTVYLTVRSTCLAGELRAEILNALNVYNTTRWFRLQSLAVQDIARARAVSNDPGVEPTTAITTVAIAVIVVVIGVTIWKVT